MPASQFLHLPYDSGSPSVTRLHVFEQDGGWHWGVTIPRAVGVGFKLIAFSESTFSSEGAARADGAQALARLAARTARSHCTTDAE